MQNQTIVNVIFDAGKGVSAQSGKEYNVGTAIGELPNAKRKGYQFDGWYYEGQKVLADTVLQAEDDITLLAQWTKLEGKQYRRPWNKQAVAAIVLSSIIVVLVVLLLIANNVVSRNYLHDSYYDAQGNALDVTYYIHKDSEGNYGLFTKFFGGELLEKNEDGYFIIPESGNQYSIDASTGESSLYAVVDYDSESGETLGYGSRVMIFPQIRQANCFSIKVENEYGTYCIYRDSTGTVQIEGFESNPFIAYDKELYAYLCVSCGYTLSMQKINFKSEQVPLTQDGEIDYSAYGLAKDNSVYKAKYTITGALIDSDGVYSADPNTQYTVYVGDAILSNAGYYVKLENRDAVYIVDDDLATTVLQPVESMVTALVVYPTTVSSYSMVQNFILSKLPEFTLLEDYPKKGETESDDDYEARLEQFMTDFTNTLKANVVTSFSYVDLDARMNTMLTNTPYIIPDDLGIFEGYTVNDNNISTVLSEFYQMEISKVCKLGFTAEDLKTYGLDENVLYIAFYPPILDENNNVFYSDAVYNQLLISTQPNEDGNYYIASFLSNMIVEVNQAYMTFIDWDFSDWYNQYVFQHNISYMKDMELTIGGQHYYFHLDNSKSYTYTVTDAQGNEKTYVIDFNTTPSSYYMKDGEPTFTVGSSNVVLYYSTTTSDFANHPEEFKTVDYTYTYNYTSDSGQPKTKTYTGIQNFRYLYQILLTMSIEGDVDATEFQQKTGLTLAETIATKTPDLVFSYSMEDLAKYLNVTTYTDASGVSHRNYTENNSLYAIVRLYQYDDWKSLITIEVPTYNEATGEYTIDATNVATKFYVDASIMQKLLTNVGKVISGETKTIYTEEEYNQYIVNTDSKY